MVGARRRASGRSVRRRRAGDAGPRWRPTRPTRCAQLIAALRPRRSPTAAGSRCATATSRSAPGAARRSTTRFDPATHHRVAGAGAVPRRPRASSPTACRTARRASRSSSCGPRRCCRRSTFLLGGNGWDDRSMPDNVRWLGHVGTADHNAFNCSAARGAQRHPREHGRQRLVAGDAGVRGGRRRRLPDHRRLGGHRGLPRARGARCWSPQRRRRGRRAPGARWTRRARDAIGAAAARRVLAEHTYAAPRRAARGAARGERGRDDRRRCGSSSSGCRSPRRGATGTPRTTAAWCASSSPRGHDVLFLERDVPWYAGTATCPAAVGPRPRSTARLDELADRFAADVARRRPRHRRLLRARRRRRSAQWVLAHARAASPRSTTSTPR